MTTIAALNVRLGMDASNFSQGVNLARNEVAKVTSIMRQSVPATEKLRAETALLDKAFSATGKQSKEYANALTFLNRKYGEVQVTQTGMMGQLKQMAAAYVGFHTVTKSIKLAIEIEDANVAFEVLTGSVNDAKVLFEQVRRFAAASPITFSNAAQATRTLMSFGVEAQRIQPILRMLSDVTGGNNERFKFLTLAFAQMSAAGRLMGQDLLQMINAGFNPLQQISKTTGESLVDLKKRMEDGGISADEVTRAFEAATAEGGMFNGMTERLAETMGGKLNIALSDLEKAGAAAGQAIAPLVIAMTDGFSESNSVLNGLVFLVEKFADGAGFAAANVKDAYTLMTTLDISKMEALGKHLDMIRLRDMRRAREQAREQEGQGEGQFETQAKRVAAAQAMTEKQRKAAEDAAEAGKKRQSEASKQHAKDAADRVKEIEKLRKTAETAFSKDMRNAKSLLDAQREYFAKQRKADQDRRDQITKGPQAADVGSAEAARIIAEQRNAQLANRMVPNREAKQDEIMAKTKELLIAQAVESRRQAELLIAVKAATAAMLDTRPKLFRG
jgi:tape measure domain-containing protein